MYQKISETMKVRAHREHVPDQRAAELRPKLHRVRVRQEPVEEPGPAQVQQRKHGRAHHGENRHGLGDAIDRGAPLLVQQQQDRRDQRAGVPDPDPPYEIGDREAPGDGNVDAPNTHADDEQIDDDPDEQRQQRQGKRHRGQPAAGRRAGQHDVTDLRRYARQVVPLRHVLGDARLRLGSGGSISTWRARGHVRTFSSSRVRVAQVRPGRSCAESC